jgi:hypothetical protein
MAGSLNHILNNDGTFAFDYVETHGDKIMALQECHQIIAELLEMFTLVETGDPALHEPSVAAGVHGIGLSDKQALLKLACTRLGFPVPNGDDYYADVPLSSVTVPVIQTDLHGAESAYKPQPDREWVVFDRATGKWLGKEVPGEKGRPESRLVTRKIEEAVLFTISEADEWVALDERYLKFHLAPGLTHTSFKAP